jgi:ubiquinone biosynthesis protein Coq4
MRNVVVTGCPRADLGEVGALTAFGVAQLGVEYVDYQSYQEAPK